jgi:hypothetical protein
MYDIDDLIEPRKRGQPPRDPFAQRFEQVKKGHGEQYQYDIIGQFYPEPEIGRDYQQKYKGREAHIEYMSPDEYMNKIGDIDVKSYLEYDSRRPIPISREKINLYKQDALRGDKFAMPWIEYKEGQYDGQEGRHRAIMAKELGVEKMPVVIINRAPMRYEDPSGWAEVRDKEYSRKKKQNPFTFEEELI